MNVFISYRREDSGAYAGRLFDRLKAEFGENQVFMDITALGPGVDFVEAIDKAVGSCKVLIALIGDRWADAPDDQGKRRLDNPEDFVRLEVSSALRGETFVIPVLVGNARMPKAKQLPDDLKPLIRRNALELSDTRWEYDVSVLIEEISKKTGLHVKKRKPTLRSVFVFGFVFIAGVIGVIAYWQFIHKPYVERLENTNQLISSYDGIASKWDNVNRLRLKLDNRLGDIAQERRNDALIDWIENTPPIFEDIESIAKHLGSALICVEDGKCEYYETMQYFGHEICRFTSAFGPYVRKKYRNSEWSSRGNLLEYSETECNDSKWLGDREF